MTEIVAPYEWVRRPSERAPTVFLAGGITGCWDWQAAMVKKLNDEFILFNPRRPDFDVNDPSASEVQIAWEHRHLRRANVILFWFPSETLCPITLYELGVWSAQSTPLYVGVEPGYKRTDDILIQTRLIRPEIQIVPSLDDLTQQIQSWYT